MRSLVFSVFLAFIFVAVSVVFVSVTCFTILAVLFLLCSHVCIDLFLWDLIAIFIVELLGLAAVFLLVFTLFFEVLLSVVLLSLLVIASVRVSHCIVVLLELVLLLLLLEISKLICLQTRGRNALSLCMVVKLVEGPLSSS